MPNNPIVGLTFSDSAFVMRSEKKTILNKLVTKSFEILRYVLPERLFSYILKTSIGTRIRQKSIDAIAKSAASIVDLLSSKLNATILLIPHSTNPILDVDEINERIYELAKNKDYIKIVNFKKYSASEIKQIIGQCDFFIGTKMHACIAAWSQAVPTVAIASVISITEWHRFARSGALCLR